MIVVEAVVLNGRDVKEDVEVPLIVVLPVMVLQVMVFGSNLGAASVTRLVPLQQERSVRLSGRELSQQNTVSSSLQAQTTAPARGTSIMLN